MPRSDHFVIDKFVLRSQMAFQAFLGAMDHAPRIVHSQHDGLLVRPGPGCMRPQPTRRRAVAILAGDALGNLKRASARLCRSWMIQVEYSFCRIRLPATGFTLP